MKKKRMTCFSGALPLLLLLAALPMFLSCHQEEFLAGGDAIVFGASTSWRNGPGTRTEYTGLDENGMTMSSSSGYERILWKASDIIRIISPQARTVGGDGFADYAVTPGSVSGKSHTASVAAVSDGGRAPDGLKWRKGTDRYAFFAVYPSPLQNDAVATLRLLGTDAAQFEGTVPAVQAVTAVSGRNYLPDMDYAFMYAVAGDVPRESDVHLAFEPLVTAFEIGLTAEDDAMASKKLTGLELVSASTMLSGDFSVRITAAGVVSSSMTVPTPFPVGRSVRIDLSQLPGNGVFLDKTAPTTFTLFALPVGQEKVSLRLTFDGGTAEETTRTLPFKADLDDDGTVASHEWVPFPACRKAFIRNLGVPEAHWEYTLTLPVPELVIKRGAYDGQGSSYLNSYRTKASAREVVDVVTEYSLADDDGNNLEEWTAELPAGLRNVAVANYSTDTRYDKVVRVSVAANDDPVVDDVIPELVYRAEHMKATPAAVSLDLSLYDFVNLSTPRASGKPVTANCYVIDRPGTFRFPLVYGNAVDYSREGVALWDHGINYRSYLVATPTSLYPTALHRFDGGAISSPYILDDLGLGTSDVEAVVVWEEVEGEEYAILGALSVQDLPSEGMFYDPVQGAYKTSVPYLCFSIPVGTINPDERVIPTRRITGCRPGNALVAIRLKTAKTVAGVEYAAGTILWSWHLWLTDGADTDGDHVGDTFSPVTVSLPSNNALGPAVDFMRMNLGWVDSPRLQKYKDRVFYIRFTQTGGSADPVVLKVIQVREPEGAGASSISYQFGRKDPLVPSIYSEIWGAYNNWRNQTVWSPAGYTVVSGAFALPVSDLACADFSPSIQYPHHFFPHGTLSEITPSFAWDMVPGERRVFKTVYDPSPPGYSVAPLQAFFFIGSRVSEALQYNVPYATYGDIRMVDLNGDGAYNEADCNNGVLFYTDDSRTATLFFPWNGMRRWTDSSLDFYHTAYSNWWTSTTLNTLSSGYGRAFYLSTRDLSFASSGRGYAMGVFAVKEFQP